MGYRHTKNLYKDDRILQFKKVYATEKIHGTSTTVEWKDGKLHFRSGGCKYEQFVNLFDQDFLTEKFTQLSGAENKNISIYGEGYGGKMQGMSKVYGPDLKFIAFEVKKNGIWLSVPSAAEFSSKLGLEFVYYKLISTDIESINAERDAPSVQAKRNGMGDDHPREGVVLRPPFEVRTEDYKERLLVKHKSEAFSETRTKRKVGVKPEVLTEAKTIAKEWVTEMRLAHVLDKLPQATGMEHTRMVIEAMLEDVRREGEGEFVETKIVTKAISSETVSLWRKHLQP